MGKIQWYNQRVVVYTTYTTLARQYNNAPQNNKLFVVFVCAKKQNFA